MILPARLKKSLISLRASCSSILKKLTLTWLLFFNDYYYYYQSSFSSSSKESTGFPFAFFGLTLLDEEDECLLAFFWSGSSDFDLEGALNTIGLFKSADASFSSEINSMICSYTNFSATKEWKIRCLSAYNNLSETFNSHFNYTRFMHRNYKLHFYRF